jgi:hypothetical protein
MNPRRALLLTVLLAVASVSAWGQRAPLSLTALTHQGAAVGVLYLTFTFTVAGGVPGYTWALQSGTNSDGLTLDASSGLLSGVPLAGGIFPIGVVVTDASGAQASANFNLNVLGISTASLPDGALGAPYSQTLGVRGGTGPFSWSLVGGGNSVLPGLTLTPQGQITGTPTASGTFTFQAAVTDLATNLRSSKSFSINIPANLTITTTSLPNGTIGTSYSQTLTAVGGSGTLSWVVRVLSGTLPAGLSLSAQGQITGTPTAGGTFPFQVLVTDAATNLTATQSLSITITAALTVTTPSPLPNGTIGVSYSQTLQATGGTPPYHWSATGLPAGLTLDPNTGILSGIPTAAGASTISVTLTDAAQPQGTAIAQLMLTIGALAISPASLPGGFVGISYSATMTVTGNPTPLTWAVAIGTLPAGLNLNAATGVISGTPTVAGSSSFTISATLGAVTAIYPLVQQQFTLVISAPPSVTVSGLPSIGVAATQPPATVSLSGGTYPLNITGTMTLTFASAAGGSQPYDAKFASGPATTANFTIAAGTSQGLFSSTPFTSVPVMTGTVAGTITITTSLKDSAGNTLPPPAPIVITVNPTVPVITNVTPCAITTSGFSISVIGRSTPRDMTSALFHFTSPTNAQLASADVTVPLTSAFTSWYSNSASNAFGSTFRMTVQFSFTGPPGTTVPFTTVTATLTNSIGTSTPPVAGQPSQAICP